MLLGESPATKPAEPVDGGTRQPLGAGTVVALILLPIVQIMIGTVGNMMLAKGSMPQKLAAVIGAAPLALLTAVIVAYLVVGHQQRWGLAKRGLVLDSALPDVAVIVFAGFLIAAALRASQGSATVAILTAAGLMAQPIADVGYSSTQVALVTLAIGFGGLGLSHINDSGFWIVTKYLGLSVKDGLRTWTVLSTIFSLTSFLLTWGVFALVS